MGMLLGEVAAEQQSTMESWLEELARRLAQYGSATGNLEC